ncbi:MAG: hypothetical protein LUQ21_01205, partial [Methanothrix sp.]|nr:hypothetical protein [Methanothrix sp.]
MRLPLIRLSPAREFSTRKDLRFKNAELPGNRVSCLHNSGKIIYTFRPLLPTPFLTIRHIDCTVLPIKNLGG